MRVIYVNQKMGGKKNNGFIGMNKMAAKSPQIRMKYPYPKNTFLIYNKMPAAKKERTLRHEVIEKELMEKGGYSYPKAHKVSSILESNKLINVKSSKRARGYLRKL